MTATIVESSAPTDAIAAEMFEFLWGSKRGRIPTAVDHAYESIWRQLVTANRKPGERLSDVELAAQLGVSRTPVRQALHRLARMSSSNSIHAADSGSAHLPPKMFASFTTCEPRSKFWPSASRRHGSATRN